ncbi:MAG: lipopolysaccharide biosynthesis protein [Candidatus Micrarchaeaceae archaeon]
MADEKEKKKSAARTFGIKAAKNTLTYTVSTVVSSAITLVLLIVLAMLLKPADFGIYAIAIAFYTILSVGGHFGMGTALRKELPSILDDKEKIARFISNGYVVALLVAFVISIVAMAFSSAIAVYVYHDPGLSNTLALAALLVLGYALFNLTLATLVALGKVVAGSAIDLVYSIVQLIATVALVLLGYGVFGAIVGLGISLIVPSILGIFIISKHIEGRFVKPDIKTIKRLMGFSAPIVASNVSMQVPPNLAILLLGVYTTASLVGNYNAAFKFGNFVSVFLIANGFMLLPEFAKVFSNKDLKSKVGRIYNGSVYYTLLILLPVLIYVMSTAQPLIYLLFSSIYSSAPFFFIVIVFGSGLAIISTYAGNLIIGYGDTKRFMLYQVAAVALQIVLLFALTPFLHADGVLLALFIISPIIIDVMYINALYKQFSFRHEFGQLLRVLVPAVLLFVLLYFAASYMHQSQWSLITNLAGTILLYPPLLVLFGGIKRENIGLIRDISKSLRTGWLAEYPIRYVEIFLNAKSGKSL